MVVVEYQHQFCRKRPHSVVHYYRIMDVELHTMIDAIQRVVEIDHGLRRELCRQTHVAALGKSILCSNRSFPSVRKVSKWNWHRHRLWQSRSDALDGGNGSSRCDRAIHPRREQSREKASDSIRHSSKAGCRD